MATSRERGLGVRPDAAVPGSRVFAANTRCLTTAGEG